MSWHSLRRCELGHSDLVSTGTGTNTVKSRPKLARPKALVPILCNCIVQLNGFSVDLSKVIDGFSSLSHSELKAFSGVVDALRAGGDLTEERAGVLGDLARLLHISHTRRNTEIRRALNTELLATIAVR
jgi:hypothetical protein